MHVICFLALHDTYYMRCRAINIDAFGIETSQLPLTAFDCVRMRNAAFTNIGAGLYFQDAPELYFSRAEELPSQNTPRADIYGLGVVLGLMLVGGCMTITDVYTKDIETMLHELNVRCLPMHGGAMSLPCDCETTVRFAVACLQLPHDLVCCIIACKFA